VKMLLQKYFDVLIGLSYFFVNYRKRRLLLEIVSFIYNQLFFCYFVVLFIVLV